MNVLHRFCVKNCEAQANKKNYVKIKYDGYDDEEEEEK